jgi:predicted phosphodiesterase
MRHFRKTSLTLIAMLLVATTLAASPQEGLAIAHGPYLQQLTESSLMIVWLTSEASVSWVEYGDASNLRSFPTYGSVVRTARASTHGLIDADTKLHRILIEGLEPGQEYRYRAFSKQVVDLKPYEVTFGESVVSEVYSFTTLDRAKESFSFTVLSDIHEDAERLDAKLQAISWDAVDLMFYTGDSIHYYEDDSQIFDGFLDISVDNFASETPLIQVRGNHETRGKYARALYDFFPTASGKYYFSFNHGPVHFVVLDSGEDKKDTHPVYAGLVDFDEYRRQQAEWLAEDLRTEAAQQAAFVVALFHIPPYGTRDAHGTLHVRQMWNEILNEAGVDLVLNGHTHRFARHDPEEGEHAYPIVITGQSNTTRVDVSPGALLVTVSDEDGAVVDSFSIAAKRR